MNTAANTNTNTNTSTTTKKQTNTNTTTKITEKAADKQASVDAKAVAQATGKVSSLILACFTHAQEFMGSLFARYTGTFCSEVKLELELLGESPDSVTRTARDLINAVTAGVLLAECKTVSDAKEQARVRLEKAAADKKEKIETNKIELAAKAAQGDDNAAKVLAKIESGEKEKAASEKADKEKQASKRLEDALANAREVGLDIGAVVAPVSHASEAWDSLLKRAAIAARTAGISPDDFITLAEQLLSAE